MSNQIVISSGAKVRNLSGVLTGTAGVVNSLGINVPSGIPQLDGSGKILVSQLPNSVMEYKGTWNAATNTPTLVNGTGNQGDVYLCNVAGTVNFGAGPITFSVGDQVIYSGTIWQRASGATGTVTSVAVTESGDALTITGSPITTSGTINIGFAGTSGQYVNGAGGLTTFPSLTGFVPYTGATGNVNLGEFGLTSGFVGFDLTPTGTPTGVGTLSWDSAYRTLQLIDGDGDTTLQIGQEQRALIHNNTGATLTDGQVVYVTGSTGNLPTVALASNTLEASSSVTFGVVTETIANGADGFVTISGTVNGLDTLAYNEGDALYLGSTAGTFTNVKPVAPANLVLIGYMIKKAGGNGSIFVKIQNGYELEELHDVLVTSVANNQGLFWDSATSLWKNNTIAGVLGYTPANAATYVPYSGATQNVNLGVYNIELGAVLTNKTANGGLLMKQNTTISAEVSGTNYTSIKPFDTRYLYFDFGQPSSYKSFRIDANGLTNATLRTYTIPDLSGTLALLEGSQTFTGDKTFDGITNFDSAVLFNALQNQFSNGLQIAKTNTILRSTGYMTISANAGTASSIKFSDGNSTYDTLFNFDNTGNRNYTFPALSGTISLLDGSQTFTGAKTFNNSVKNEYGTFIKENQSDAVPSGYKGLFATTNGLEVTNSNTSSAFLNFNNAGNYTYTFPASSGTVALTSNLSAYLPLTGGTLTGDLSIDKSSASLFLKSATGGSNSIGFLVNGVSVGGITVTSTFYQFNNNTSYGYLFKNAAGNNLLSIQDSGAAVFLGSVSATIGDFSSWVKSTGYRLDGMTAGSGALYYNAGANRVTLANYNASGILTFEVNGGATALTLASTGAATFSSSVTAYGPANDWGLSIWGSTTTGQSYGGIIRGGTNSSDVAFKVNNAANTIPYFNIRGDGNVGIGTSSPGTPLYISSSQAALFTLNSTDANGGYMLFNKSGSAFGYVGSAYHLTTPAGSSNDLAMATATGNLIFNTGSSLTERLRITSGGTILINKTNSLSVGQLEINGSMLLDGGGSIYYFRSQNTSHIYAFYGASNQIRVYNNAIGVIGYFNDSTGAYTATSDSIMKKNILDAGNALDIVSKIKVRSYDWKGTGVHEPFGVIAQELYEVAPSYVSKPIDDKSKWGVSKAELVPMLVKAVQEEDAKVNAQELRIQQLESQIEELKALIAAK